MAKKKAAEKIEKVRSEEKEARYQKYLEAEALGAPQIAASLYADGRLSLEEIKKKLEQ